MLLFELVRLIPSAVLLFTVLEVRLLFELEVRKIPVAPDDPELKLAVLLSIRLSFVFMK